MRVAMMMMPLTVFLFGALAVAAEPRPSPGLASNLGTGPFGIDKGAPLAGLKVRAVAGKPGDYQVMEIPRPMPPFADVVVQAFPETGVCALTGTSSVHANDRDGAIVRSALEAVARNLEDRYGASIKVDDCLSEYDCEPEYWAMQVRDHGRVYQYAWKGTRQRPLPAGLAEVELMSAAASTTDTYEVVRFSFNNRARCEGLAAKNMAPN
jgi:hypothetical protein